MPESKEDESLKYSKEVAKGSFWTLSGSMVFYAFSFVFTIFVARFFPMEQVGLFYLAAGIISLPDLVTDLCLSNSLARYIPFFEAKGERGREHQLINLSFGAVIASSVFLIAAFWLSAGWLAYALHNPSLAYIIQLVTPFLLANNLLKVSAAYLRGRTDMKGSSILQIVQNSLKLAFTVLFFYLAGASAAVLSMALILSLLCAFIFFFLKYYPAVRRLPQPAHPRSGAAVLRELVPFGLTMTLLSSFWIIFQSSNQILLGYLTEPAKAAGAIAVFSIVSNLASVLAVFPGAVTGIFLPLISRLYGKGAIHQMGPLAYTAQRWALFLAMPIAAIMIVFSADALDLIYGNSYAAGAVAMSIIVAAFLIRSLSDALSLSLSATRNMGLQLKVMLIAGLVSLALSVLLIPVFGITGSALALFAGFGVTTILLRGYTLKTLGFGFAPGLWRILLSGVLTLAVLFLIRPSALALSHALLDASFGGLYAGKAVQIAYLGAMSAISFAVFQLFIVAFKCLKRNDISLFIKGLRKMGVPDSLAAPLISVVSVGLEREPRFGTSG
jgi:stage V sporulation protein B